MSGRPHLRMLPQTTRLVAAQHVENEKVIETIAVQIREIHPHGKRARVTEHPARRGAKAPAPVVQPEPVRAPEIIADIEIGRAVAIHIAEHRGETPLPRRRDQVLL